MKTNVMTMSAVMAMVMIGAAAQAASIQISVTGIADSTEMGYTVGQSYTFNWVINDGYTGSTNDSFGVSSNSWCAERTTEPILWSSVSGDGLVGTYSRPSGADYAPYDTLESSATVPNSIHLLASNDDRPTSTIGLTVNGSEVSTVEARISIGVDFVFNAAFTNPAEYFAAYIGTHSPPAEYNNFIQISDVYSQQVAFAPTSITIATVPEPATIAILGLGALGLLRRRR